MNSQPGVNETLTLLDTLKSVAGEFNDREEKLEKDFRAAIAAGKKDEAKKLLPGVHSALDKAVKSGVLPRPTVNRKKSRLTLALN